MEAAPPARPTLEAVKAAMEAAPMEVAPMEVTTQEAERACRAAAWATRRPMEVAEAMAQPMEVPAQPMEVVRKAKKKRQTR